MTFNISQHSEYSNILLQMDLHSKQTSQKLSQNASISQQCKLTISPVYVTFIHQQNDKLIMQIPIHSIYKIKSQLDQASSIIELILFIPKQVRFLINQLNDAQQIVQQLEYLRLPAENIPYNLLANQTQNINSNFSKHEINMFDEFRRFNVKISLPDEQTLSAMIFGEKIDVRFLQYLIKLRPPFNQQTYKQNVQNLLQKLKEDHGEEPLLQQLIDFKSTYFYDPRSLFASDSDFYSCLLKHKQAVSLLSGVEPSQKANENSESSTSNSSTGEDEEEEKAQADKNPKVALQKIKNFFTKQSPKETRKDKKKCQQINIEFNQSEYAHGLLFEPTIFRLNQHYRDIIKMFLSGQNPYSDTIVEVCSDVNSDAAKPQCPNYRLSYINACHSLCRSYPALIAIPATATDEILRGAASFRSKSRIPALVWRDIYSGASISRCSQPGKGFGLVRSSEDEALIRAIQQTGMQAVQAKQVIIFDARPKLSAFANRLVGKGHQSAKAYNMAQVVYCDIDNIHVVRDAYLKVCNLINKQNTAQYIDIKQDILTTDELDQVANKIAELGNDQIDISRELLDSGWLQLSQLVLRAGIQVAKTILGGQHCVVHCSDGWDRTSQLCSLGLILLDSYYRSVIGFAKLIEMQWLQFGHQFDLRNKYVSYKHHRTQTSPIFIQFLDCVYQIYHQFPDEFQFTAAFLRDLCHEYLTRSTGAFLLDQERQRVQMCSYQLFGGLINWVKKELEKKEQRWVQKQYIISSDTSQPAVNILRPLDPLIDIQQINLLKGIFF